MNKCIACFSALAILTTFSTVRLQADEIAKAADTPTAQTAVQSTGRPSAPAIKTRKDAARVKTATAASAATATQQQIMKLLQLPVEKHQGGCLRSVIDQDISGREMFALEKCPFIKTADLEIMPETEERGASKGKLRISVSCSIKNNDYYAGKVSKTFDQNAEATITAEYVYALKDLSLKNVAVEGDKFCAHPIKAQIKKYE